MSATLRELAEPVLKSVCRLNRLARKGGSMPPAEARRELNEQLDEMGRRAAGAGLESSFAAVHPALAIVADEFVIESGLAGAHEWRPLLEERGLAGDAEEPGAAGGPGVGAAAGERFYAIVDTELEQAGRSASPGALDRLSVLYMCLGIGYAGPRRDRPDERRELMGELSSRLRPLIEADRSALIVPEAYEHVDQSDLVRPPGRSLVGMAIAAAAVVAVVIGGNAVFYHLSSRDLRSALGSVVSSLERAGGGAGDAGGAGGAAPRDVGGGV